MKSLYLKEISIIAPGISDWSSAKEIFNQKTDYVYEKVSKKLETILPSNENRRASRTIKLSLSVIQQLFQQVNDSTHENYIEPEKLRYVFTSCNGDLTIFHQICTALTLDGRPVSPTKFHNSVHNAPAGYGAIALNAQTPSTSIAGYKDSFANGILEASVQLSTHNPDLPRQDCLLTAYDEVPPEPLLSVFPISDEFSCSLLLSTDPQHALCQLDISLTHGQNVSDCKEQKGPLFEALELMRHSNPQAKCIPLLAAIAREENKTIYLDYNQSQVAIQVTQL